MPAKSHRHRRILTGVCLAFTLGIALLTAAKAWLDHDPRRRDRLFDRAQGTPFVLIFTALDRYAGWEQQARDWLATNTFAHRAEPNPEIVFLGLDQASRELDSLFDDDLAKSPTLQLMKQRFPWNRAVYARIADRLMEAGATMVIFDIIFPSPQARDEKGLEPDGDAEFRAALERHAGRVVIGSNLLSRTQNADVAQTTASNMPAHILPARELMPRGPDDLTHTGFVTVVPDGDGIVRRVHYRTTVHEYFGWPPVDGAPELLSLVARALALSGRSGLVPTTHQPVAIRFTDGIFTRSLYEIFDEGFWNAPPFEQGKLFRGKTVLIGAAGNEAEDRLATPFGTVLAPSIHLSALNAALNQDFLHLTTLPQSLALIFGAGAVAWLLGAFFRQPLLRLAVLAATFALYHAVAQMSFNGTGLTLLIASPMLALAGSGVTWTAWEALLEFRERQRTRQMMERYVSKDIVKELLDNRESFLNVLGGARRSITVMFSDVRGFTTRTESGDEHQLVKQLNEYFDEMVRIVFANHGTLDKFIGDAVMAHWGSIVTEGKKTDAVRALRTAMEMRRALVRLNEGWVARKIEPIAIGIGINHGEAIVGNLGCEAKMEVSVIGDAVNVASRLEGVTKSYHLDLVIGEQVEPLVREEFVVRSVDLIKVKGKTRGVAVFTVLDERRNGAAPAWLARHEEAVRLYRAGDFPGAEKAWRDVLAQAPGDPIAEVFLNHCRDLQAHSPEGTWDGVYEMKSK